MRDTLSDANRKYDVVISSQLSSEVIRQLFAENDVTTAMTIVKTDGNNKCQIPRNKIISIVTKQLAIDELAEKPKNTIDISVKFADSIDNQEIVKVVEIYPRAVIDGLKSPPISLNFTQAAKVLRPSRQTAETTAAEAPVASATAPETADTHEPPAAPERPITAKATIYPAVYKTDAGTFLAGELRLLHTLAIASGPLRRSEIMDKSEEPFLMFVGGHKPTRGALQSPAFANLVAANHIKQVTEQGPFKLINRQKTKAFLAGARREGRKLRADLQPSLI